MFIPIVVANERSVSLPGGIKSFLFTKLIKMQEAWRVLLSGASLSGDNSPFSVGYEVRMGEGKRERQKRRERNRQQN